eukprot:9473649-Pyramimonas_sp.AAC.1
MHFIGKQSLHGNPSTSYAALFFDANATFPSGYCDAVEQQMSNKTKHDPVCQASFLLGPTDAVVLMMCTPPPVKHFAFDMYVSARFQNVSETAFYYPQVIIMNLVRFKHLERGAYCSTKNEKRYISRNEERYIRRQLTLPELGGGGQ